MWLRLAPVHEQSVRRVPRNTLIDNRCTYYENTRERLGEPFFRPARAPSFVRVRSTACAMGCILSPLRGWLWRNLIQHADRAGFRTFRGHQIGKLKQFSNSRLRFSGFIWYKQFTESMCVAGWALFCNSRARPASNVLEG